MHDRPTWLTARRRLMAISALCFGLLTTLAAYAESAIEVTEAWARATVPGQRVAGVYLVIRSNSDARLVGVRSPAAKTAEIHSMSNAEGVMKMRRLTGLDLPAGRSVRLEPGGNHIMMLDIEKPLGVGERVPVTLIVEQKGKRKSISVQADVRALSEGGSGHKHHQ
jgi:copper(I)-binding protein